MPSARTTAAFRVEGMEGTKQRLSKLARLGGDMPAFYKKVAVELMKSFEKNFQKDGAEYQAGGWPPLKPVYYKWKIHTNARLKKDEDGSLKLEKGAKILRDTGRGKASIRTKSSAKHAEIATSDGRSYMAKHDTGTKHRGGRLPQRKIIPEWRHVKKHIVKLLDWEIRKAARS